MRIKTIAKWVPIGVALVVAVVLIYSVPVYFLWNWLAPTLFKLPALTIWQAIGLTFLCNLLFNAGNGSSRKGS